VESKSRYCVGSLLGLKKVPEYVLTQAVAVVSC